VRAVRDHLADCLVTLPALLERGESASVHCWFAGLDGLRRELFPLLTRAYERWEQGDGGRALKAATQSGVFHWASVCARVVALHAHRGAEAETAIEVLSSAPGSRL